jgi:hypothetical protein
MGLQAFFLSLFFLGLTTCHPGHDLLPGYAPEVYDSPPGLGFIAWFVGEGTDDVHGRVFALADPVGRGVVWHVLLDRIPGTGPYSEFFPASSFPGRKDPRPRDGEERAREAGW